MCMSARTRPCISTARFRYVNSVSCYSFSVLFIFSVGTRQIFKYSGAPKIIRVFRIRIYRNINILISLFIFIYFVEWIERIWKLIHKFVCLVSYQAWVHFMSVCVCMCTNSTIHTASWDSEWDMFMNVSALAEYVAMVVYNHLLFA